MLKAKGSQNGRDVFIIGLSHMNLDRLRQDMPIIIHKEEVGIPFDISIFSLPTEEDLEKAIRPNLTKDAIVTDHYRNRPKRH